MPTDIGHAVEDEGAPRSSRRRSSVRSGVAAAVTEPPPTFNDTMQASADSVVDPLRIPPLNRAHGDSVQ